jgi:hypothetical protein
MEFIKLTEINLDIRNKTFIMEIKYENDNIDNEMYNLLCKCKLSAFGFKTYSNSYWIKYKINDKTIEYNIKIFTNFNDKTLYTLTFETSNSEYQLEFINKFKNLLNYKADILPFKRLITHTQVV